MNTTSVFWSVKDVLIGFLLIVVGVLVGFSNAVLIPAAVVAGAGMFPFAAVFLSSFTMKKPFSDGEGNLARLAAAGAAFGLSVWVATPVTVVACAALLGFTLFPASISLGRMAREPRITPIVPAAAPPKKPRFAVSRQPER